VALCTALIHSGHEPGSCRWPIGLANSLLSLGSQALDRLLRTTQGTQFIGTTSARRPVIPSTAAAPPQLLTPRSVALAKRLPILCRVVQLPGRHEVMFTAPQRLSQAIIDAAMD
jgi:hypothetical protein